MNPHKIIVPNIAIGTPTNVPINTPRNQSQFYATLRRYTERLKQQRDISLGYLNRINQLEALLRIKDSQIERLNRANRQLSDKLSLYSSVLQRSQTKRPMRMSMILGNNNMTQSIIQTKAQLECIDTVKPFQQFFIADLSEISQEKVKFRYVYNTFSTQQLTVSNFLVTNCSPSWEPEPVTNFNMERKSSFVLLMIDSPLTRKNHNKEKHLEFIQKINPSFYHFVPCLIQKQITSIGGKFYWVPIIYGFITLVPFPDAFFRLLEQLAVELKIKNEIEIKKLGESLTELIRCPVDLQVEMRYLFMNKLQLWKIPDLAALDTHALMFSLGAIEKFALQLIIDVLILLLLQIPITLISQDQLLLCQFMFYFVYIIKPLKYPYPIVFNLNEKLKQLLGSPFSTFIGCADPKIVEPYLNERAVFDLDKKVAKSWPLLDHLDTSRQFLMKVAHKTGNYGRFSLVTQQIIKGHQYRELEPYWKDFSKTQLYKNYVQKQ